MKNILVFAFLLISTTTIFAQNDQPLIVKPTPKPLTIRDTVNSNVGRIEKKEIISRENREAAYLNLLKGQRFFRNADSLDDLTQARAFYRSALDLNPYLTEAYTGYADIAWLLYFRVSEKRSKNDLEDTIALSEMAIKLNPNSYVPRRFLAMAYTEKSGLREGRFIDSTFAEKAIAQWTEVARIDPRNAEAFAFLSVFFDQSQNKSEQIKALKGWLGSTAPIESRYYQDVIQTNETLSPDIVPLKLGKALLEAGRSTEAIEYFSRAVADNPNDEPAIELLAEAIQSGDVPNPDAVILLLQQAIYINQKNVILKLLHAELQWRSGKNDEAIKFLRDTIAKMPADEESSTADLQIKLGDIYYETENYGDAVRAFQTALKLRNLETSIVTEEERLFVITTYEKIIKSYKDANQLSEAKSAIDKMRMILDKKDTVADEFLIDFYRQTGNRPEALKTVREMRLKNAEDYGLLRLEATILTENGKVDEAVGLIIPLIGKTSPQYNDFTNHIFISTLYTEASRGKDAILAANKAFTAAGNAEEKQIAKLVLASAQFESGDFKASEETLRALLKQTPRNPMALNNLGYFMVEKNTNLEEALKLIQQAVEIDPNNASYLDSLGWAYFKLGKLEEAESSLVKAVRISPSSTILEHLGDVYQKQNKIELAKTNWRKALNLSINKEEIQRLNVKLK